MSKIIYTIGAFGLAALLNTLSGDVTAKPISSNEIDISRNETNKTVENVLKVIDYTTQDNPIQNNPQISQDNPQISQDNPQISQDNSQISKDNPQISQDNSQIIKQDTAPQAPAIITSNKSGEIDVPTLQSSKWTLGVYLHFTYRSLEKSPEIEKYLDPQRETFDLSMPGFAKFLKVGDQLPTLGLEVLVGIPYHFLPKDKIELLVSGDFSSSKIFGSVKDKKVFDAEVGALDFGDTPTTWEQTLNFYGSLGFGLRYSPVIITFSEDFKTGIFLGLKGGISYTSTKSKMDIHVDSEELFLEFGYPALNSVDIYRDIITYADTKGVGGFIEPSVGLNFEFLKDFAAYLAIGRCWEWFPSFSIHERKESDATFPSGNVKIKDTTLEHIQHSLSIKLGVGYLF